MGFLSLSAAASARAVQLTLQHLSQGEVGKTIRSGIVAAVGLGLGAYGAKQFKSSGDAVIETGEKIEREEKFRGKV